LNKKQIKRKKKWINNYDPSKIVNHLTKMEQIHFNGIDMGYNIIYNHLENKYDQCAECEFRMMQK
jgi:hypothetical protein